MDKVVRKFEIPADLSVAVERLAKDTHRTPSQVISDAVAQLISGSDDIAIDLERWAEYQRTGNSIDIDVAFRRLRARSKTRRRRAARPA